MNFKKDLARFHNNCTKAANARFRRLGLVALQKVVKRTPVRTGCTRSNWNVGLNEEPDACDLDLADKSGGKAIAQGSRVIASVKIGSTIFLTNRVPYIVLLERGYSRQYPGGFLHLTVRELNSLLERGLL